MLRKTDFGQTAFKQCFADKDTTAIKVELTEGAQVRITIKVNFCDVRQSNNLHGPAKQCVKHLLMETVSIHTLRWTLQQRGESVWMTSKDNKDLRSQYPNVTFFALFKESCFCLLYIITWHREVGMNIHIDNLPNLRSSYVRCPAWGAPDTCPVSQAVWSVCCSQVSACWVVHNWQSHLAERSTCYLLVSGLLC